MQIETLDRRNLTEAEARPVAELLVKVCPRRTSRRAAGAD